MLPPREIIMYGKLWRCESVHEKYTLYKPVNPPVYHGDTEYHCVSFGYNWHTAHSRAKQIRRIGKKLAHLPTGKRIILAPIMFNRVIMRGGKPFPRYTRKKK